MLLSVTLLKWSHSIVIQFLVFLLIISNTDVGVSTDISVMKLADLLATYVMVCFIFGGYLFGFVSVEMSCCVLCCA